MNSKIRFRMGEMEFEGEGAPAWIEKQLAKIFEYQRELSKQGVVLVKPKSEGATSGTNQSLAGYLKNKNATSKQVFKFLATANWLHMKGIARLKTSDVSKALGDSNQGRLSNPSDALGQNVAKGLCDRDGANFYVTPEGKAALGENE